MRYLLIGALLLWPTIGHADLERFDPLIRRTARKYGLDEDFYVAIVWVESRGNPRAIGPPTRFGRAYGITQILESTAAQFGVRPSELLRHPERAIDLSGRILRDLKHYVQRSLGPLSQRKLWALVAAGYVAGKNSIRSGSIPDRAYVRNYVAQVMSKRKQLQQAHRWEFPVASSIDRTALSLLEEAINIYQGLLLRK